MTSTNWSKYNKQRTRNVSYGFRMTEEENQKMKSLAKSMNMSIIDMIMKLINEYDENRKEMHCDAR